ncbi:MAG: hypothetical protein HZB51_04880 [Chloroflexi bacterium]|nr:hypothetical protein [Chloroflexota bacterium]
MKLSTSRLLFASSILFIALALSAIPTTLAQSPAPIFVPVALVPQQRDLSVELVALTLDADLIEINGHTIISGYSTFKLHNTDRVSDTVAPVGFPAWGGDQYTFDPSRFNNFSVSIDGTRVRTINRGKADLKVGGVVRSVDWYTFTVPLDTDDKKTVRFDFAQDLGDSAMPRFYYGLTSATDWKGSIGSARLTINFPESTTLEQIVAYDPPNPEFDGSSITWRFTNKEPVSNPSLTILRPSVWSDLNTKRRVAQQNANDANAHANLGNLLRQLAAADSPRRDSFAMQAVAELETAVRLDANNRTARQALGAIYESRAGPAAGPRNPAYLSLAVAQWESLAANDATVRKQLAEDYFYLGVDAQTRQDFANASTYFDKASTLAPNGAGPLFTTERMNTQRRALNLAWGRALIDQSDAATASTKARAALGDKFMTQFSPPLFYVTRAEVTTSSQSRSMIFSLAPYFSVAEMQNAASGTIAQLRQAGVDANLASDGSNVALVINVAFNSRAELATKLDALARLLPSRADWALLRAVIAPDNVEWSEADELFTHTIRYREDLDLSSACNEFNLQISDILKNLSSLDVASPNDVEAQLKRALLSYAQRGWQNALALGRVTYRAGTDEARVDACGARTLEWSPSSWRPERVGIIVAGIELIGAGILIWRWRSKSRSRIVS